MPVMCHEEMRNPNDPVTKFQSCDKLSVAIHCVRQTDGHGQTVGRSQCNAERSLAMGGQHKITGINTIFATMFTSRTYLVIIRKKLVQLGLSTALKLTRLRCRFSSTAGTGTELLPSYVDHTPRGPVQCGHAASSRLRFAARM